VRNIRRIVTGLDANGQSNLTFVGDAPNILDSAAWPGSRVSEIWVTEEMPVDNTGTVDRGARPIRHDPGPSGTIFRVVEVPPEANGKIDTEKAFAELGSTRVPTEEDSAKHPSMHATDSVDYLVVISGEMHMLMEDGAEVLLQAGDCIVQRGTKHAWVNRSNGPCVMAAILVDAKPVC
jgi:mannose-6-phosphate isomerase-like protein (cupin superfamily)